jgi:transposase
METMEKRKQRPRRSFTPEFKAEIVELCRRGDRSIGQVAKDFDLTETNVRTWVKQAEIDHGERPGLTRCACDQRWPSRPPCGWPGR